jgi:hypothetical protein
MGDQPIARLLPTDRTAQTQNKYTQTSMHLGGFVTMIPACRLAKTVHTLDRAATMIGTLQL